MFSDNAPQISASANVVSTNPSSHAWLKCKTTYPAILTEPDTYWVFNSSRIPQESQHYHIKRYGPNPGPNSTKFILFELRISNVSAKDVGWYTCGVDFKLDVIKANVFLRFEEEENEGEFVNGNLALDQINFNLGCHPIQSSTYPDF